MKTLVSLSHATTLSSPINKLPTSLQITMSSSRMTEYNSFANLSNIMESAMDPAKLRSEFLRLLGTRRSPEDILKILIEALPELLMSTDPSNTTALHTAASQG